jgi:hypothetical protein
MVQQLNTNTFCEAKWVVSATASDGTHTTVQAAINSSSSGDNIFIREGTYTENLTLKAGVNLTAYRGSGKTANVIISGNATMSSAGIATLTGVRLQTNGSFFLTVSGSAASIVNLVDVDFNITNSTGISFTSSNAGATLTLSVCSGDIASANALYSMSSAGTLNLNYTLLTNSAGSTVASTNSAGNVVYQYSHLNSPVSNSGTGGILLEYADIDCAAINSTALTIGGSGTNTSNGSVYFSGTASGISVGSTFNLYNAVVSSSNTNAITGAGTLNYSIVTFSGSSSTINTSVQAPFPLPVKQGGTSNSSATAYAVLCGGTTATGAFQSIAGVGTSGQVLTSNGAGALPTFQAAGSSGITTLSGDSGSATGATVNVHATTNAGSTVKFLGSGATLSFLVTDATNNTIIGSLSGNGSISGTNNAILGHNSMGAATSADSNTGIGSTALKLLTSGNSNTAAGAGALLNLLTGSSNIAIGFVAGDNYTSSESSNIMIGNTGTISESNVIRIGTQGSGTGQQNTCFIAGIEGVSVSNKNYVTINTSTGQLGSEAASSLFSVNIQTFTSSGTYTPTSGMIYCDIQILGGGGGGGGAPTTGVGQYSSAGGGGSGEYARGVFSAATIGASQAVTIGAAGAANSGAAGGNGGNSSVGALISANGGTGGASIAASVSATVTQGVVGGTGGSGGSFRTPGQPGGGAAIYPSFGNVFSGAGGSTQYGAGGAGIIGMGVTSSGGTAGLGYGAGGSGGVNAVSQSANSGGAGTKGVVIVTEYVIA